MLASAKYVENAKKQCSKGCVYVHQITSATVTVQAKEKNSEAMEQMKDLFID